MGLASQDQRFASDALTLQRQDSTVRQPVAGKDRRGSVRRYIDGRTGVRLQSSQARVIGPVPERNASTASGRTSEVSPSPTARQKPLSKRGWVRKRVPIERLKVIQAATGSVSLTEGLKGQRRRLHAGRTDRPWHRSVWQKCCGAQGSLRFLSVTSPLPPGARHRHDGVRAVLGGPCALPVPSSWRSRCDKSRLGTTDNGEREARGRARDGRMVAAPPVSIG